MHLQKAIELATPHDSQKLPSEVNYVDSNDIPMEDVLSLPSGSNNVVSVSDDYYSTPSTSKSSIKFNIYNMNLDCSFSVSLSENDTVGEYGTRSFPVRPVSLKCNRLMKRTSVYLFIVGHLKTAISYQWGAPECKQQISGWSNAPPANNDVTLKSLNLPPSVQLSVYVPDSPKETKKTTMNGVSGKSYVSSIVMMAICYNS